MRIVVQDRCVVLADPLIPQTNDEFSMNTNMPTIILIVCLFAEWLCSSVTGSI